MADVDITEGDTFPSIDAALKQTVDGVETPVNLTGCTVVLRMRSATLAIVTGAVTIVNATAGTVSYAWGVGDTGAPGEYTAEWRVTTGTGKVFTVPNKGSFSISIEAKL